MYALVLLSGVMVAPSAGNSATSPNAPKADTIRVQNGSCNGTVHMPQYPAYPYGYHNGYHPEEYPHYEYPPHNGYHYPEPHMPYAPCPSGQCKPCYGATIAPGAYVVGEPAHPVIPYPVQPVAPYYSYPPPSYYAPPAIQIYGGYPAYGGSHGRIRERIRW